MQNTNMPVLSVSAQASAQEAAVFDNAVQSLGGDVASQEIDAAVQSIDASMLTPQDQAAIANFIKQIDVRNTDHVMLFGANSTKKIADFSDTILREVRTKDSGEATRAIIVDLVGKLQGFNSSAKSQPKGVGKLFGKPKSIIDKVRADYSTIEANVNRVVGILEENQIRLLKDVAQFEEHYKQNLQYFKELTLHIAAGEQKLAQVRSTTLQELKDRYAASKDALDAQMVNDMEEACARFERKLNDLKVSRALAMQTAPQIRLVQKNEQLLVERIQSTITHTIPAWKGGIIIALGMENAKRATEDLNTVADATNEFLKSNADALNIGTIQTAKEVERGIIDIETLEYTNTKLIDTISEVMRIQDEGLNARRQAERRLVGMEEELKQKLMAPRG